MGPGKNCACQPKARGLTDVLRSGDHFRKQSEALPFLLRWVKGGSLPCGDVAPNGPVLDFAFQGRRECMQSGGGRERGRGEQGPRGFAPALKPYATL